MSQLALVTGAASGLGRALSDELEGRGWRVARTDIDSAAPIPLDVRDAEAFRRVVEEVGPVDLLINNAGVGVVAEAHRMQAEDWKRVMDINVQGGINGIQAVYPGMVERRSGAILNIASLAGLLGFPGMAPYATSKFATVGLTLTLRSEARRYGVKVCAFCPGFLETRIFENSVYRGIDGTKLKQGLPFPVAPVAKGARAALLGLERNRAIITYPLYASVASLPIRFNYFLAELIHRKTMSGFLACRSLDGR